MNLEELQIKIGIELKELNKQLKKASDDINEYLGPKATKKMMADNNKAIKRGLDEISRTTKYSMKKLHKDTTKEVDDMSKDIHKSLTKAFDMDKTMAKFNKDIDRSMEQAKRSVKSVCNDIRKELNAALNVKANIRVSASSSASRQSSGSRSDAAAILASSQYTAAMIVKAINAMIDTNNKNTTRLENTMNKCTDRIVAALNKTNKATNASVQEGHPSRRAKVITPKETTTATTTKGKTVGQPYGPDNKALISALKNTYKAINILNRNLSALNSLKNIKQLGTGSYGSNNPQGGTVNWRQGRKGQTIPSFKGEIIDPDVIPVEPFKQIQDIIEVINYEVKDFETALVKVNSRAVSVVKALKDFGLSKTGGYPLRGEVIDSGKLSQNKGITQKEVIIPAEFKVIDDELQQQINDAVSKIKIPKLNTLGSSIEGDLAHFTEEFDTVLSEFGSIDASYFEITLSSLKDWVKPLEESLEKIKSISKALDMGEVDIDTTNARSQVYALTDSYEALIDACKTNNIDKVRDLFGNDTSSTNSSGRRFPAPRPNKKATGSSNKGGKPPKPTIMGFGLGGFKNELDQLVELAKKAGSKIKKALSDSDSQTLGFAPYQNELHELGEAAKKVGNKIKEALFNAFNKAKKPLAEIKANAKNYKKASLVQNDDGSTSNSFFKAVKTYAKDYGATDDAIKILDKLEAKIKKASEKIKNRMKNLGKNIADLPKKGLNKLANVAKSMWSKITGIFKKGASDCSKATSGLNLKIKDLLKTALSFLSLYGLINLGKQAITQSGQLAQAESKLTALMRQRMGATNETVKVIRELAAAQANLGVVSETAMVRGAEQLSMYVHSAKALQTLIPAIANMTARRGGLFATPEDAEEIATQLGEAIREGTTTPLEQSGIYLSEKEIEKFKALRTEEARAEFLADEIAKSVGNLNEQLANTPHGAIAQLKNNFQSLLGTLGTLLVNVIQPIVKWLNVVVVAANNALKALGNMLGFDMSGGGLMGVGDIGSNGTGGIDSATDSLEEAEDAAGAAEEAVEKFKGSLMGFDEINILSDNTNKKEDDPTNITPGEGGQLTLPEAGELTEGDSIFDKFGEKMKAFMDEFLEPFKKAWELYGNDLKEEWADLIESFKNFCTSLATFLKSVWDNGGKEFVQHMAEIGLACGIAAMEIGGEILDSLARLWQHLDPSTNMNTQGFLDALNEVSVKIREFILGLGDHFESLMANGGQDVLNALGDCFMNLGEAATRGLGVVVDALDGLIDHLDPANNKITQAMLQAWEEAFLAIGDAALGFVGLLESTLKDGGQEVINALGDAFNSLLGLVGTVVKEIADALNGLFEHLDPKTNEFTQGMLKAWQGAFEGISGMAQDIGEVLSSAMDNGGQDLVNAIGDLAMKVGDAFGTVVEVAANCIGDLFKHLDPAENDIAKGAIESFEYFVNSIGDFVKSLAKGLKTFMDNGGQEFVNNVADIILIIGDLAFTIGGDILSAISKFMDSWLGHAVISTCATALELVSEVLKGLLEILEPLSPLISGVVAAFAGFQVASKVVGFITSIVTAFQALGGAGGILALVKGAFTALWGVLAANPIAATVAAIVGIGVAIVALYNKCEGFRDFIDGILKGFSGLFEAIKKHFGTLLEDVRNIFGNVIDIIVGIFTGDGEKVGTAVRELIGNILKLFGDLVVALFDIGVNLIEGLVKGIWECIKAIPKLLAGIGDFIVGFFKGLFGIHSPSTVFAELGTFLMEGLIKGILDSEGSIANAFVKISKTIIDATKDIAKTVSEKFKETKEAIKEKLKETKEVVSEKWKEIKETVSEKAKATYEVAKENWANIKDTVSEKSKEAYNAIKENWKEVKQTATDIFTETYNVTKEKWADIKDTVKERAKETYEAAKDNWTNLKQNTVDRFKETYDTVKDKFTNIRDTVKEKATKTFEDVSASWTKIKDDAATKLEQIKTDAEKRYEDVKNTLVNKIEEAKKGIVEKWEEVKNKTNECIENVRQTSEEKYNEIKETIVERLEDIKSNTEKKWEEIKKNTGTAVENIKKEAETQYAKIKDSLVSTLEQTKSAMATKWDSIKSDAISKVTAMANEASSKFAEIKTKLTSKLDEIKSSLGPKWDSLKTQASKAASDISSNFQSGISKLGSNIGSAFNTAKTTISSKLKEIGSTLKNTSWSLPKIKLPHISVSGSFSLDPPKVPKFSIEWYKRGGIIDGITPLGFSGGTMHMGGEAGKEMVVPLENTSFTSKIAQAIGQAVDNTLARSYNNMPNNNNNNSENRDVVLQLDGREFARASINSINKLQRESGRTLLDI